MPLDTSRAELKRELDKQTIADLIVRQWPSLKVKIEAWWSDYKQWEEDEEFERAFADNRMTVRYSKRGLTEKLDMMARPPGGGEQRTFLKQAKVQKGVAAAYAGNIAPEKFQVDVSMMGVVKRTNPVNFVPELGGPSRKAELGLHDLSASLLRAKKITPQLYNKPDPQDRYVFMPLPQEEDQVVFQQLNGLAKSMREQNDELYKLVRGYRSRMTRVKLACEHDMGTNFIALAPDSNINPRFRYGIGPLTKQPKKNPLGQDIGELEGDIPNTANLITARKEAAINYKRILARELFAVNEITVAYRKHGNPQFKSLFPIFAVWDGAAFKTFTMNNMGGMVKANARTISDEGRLT